jgi:SPP1 family predicted phage head-tail adaptor
MLQSRIRRGELDREIIFLQVINGENATNEDEDTGWEEIDTDSRVFAKVVQKPGREMMIADRVTFIQTTLFYVDYRTDITERNRIYYNSKVYNILSVTEPSFLSMGQNYGSERETYLEVAAEILNNVTWT